MSSRECVRRVSDMLAWKKESKMFPIGRRMDKMVLGEVVSPFVSSALLFTSLVFAGDAFVRITNYLQQGVPLNIIGWLVVYSLPSVVAQTFPMALLLAALLGFGRLSSDGEITAIIATGVRFERIVLPVAFFGLGVALLGLWFNNEIVPFSNTERQNIIDAAARRGNIRFGADFDWEQRDGDGFLTTLIHAEGGIEPGQLGKNEWTLRQVMVQQWDRKGPTVITYAERAEWIWGTEEWRLFGVRSANLTGERRLNIVAQEGQTMPLGRPAALSSLGRRVADVSTNGLRERARVLRADGDTGGALEAETEVARRTAVPWASFCFGLLGAALGVRPARSGKGISFGLSVLITFAYWIALQTMTSVARSGAMGADWALMIPNIVGLVIALVFIRRVSAQRA